MFALIPGEKWRRSAHMYRRVVGVTEVVSGLLLALIPGECSKCLF